jgi:hypothetical protein
MPGGVPQGMSQTSLFHWAQYAVAILIEHSEDRPQTRWQIGNRDRSAAVARQNAHHRLHRVVSLAMVQTTVAVLVESMQQAMPELTNDVPRRTVAAVVALRRPSPLDTRSRTQHQAGRQQHKPNSPHHLSLLEGLAHAHGKPGNRIVNDLPTSD